MLGQGTFYFSLEEIDLPDMEYQMDSLIIFME